MKRQSLEEYLAAMAKKPQTLGWDVVLAFDRDKTNYLLLQDYISRFGADSMFPPVNSVVNTVEGATHELIGLQLDKPRLSFDNAVITDSRARCLMRTVQGRTIETVQPQGSELRKVKRLGIADGLVGPQLTMTIVLKNAPSSVGEAGRVELDLSGEGATNFEFWGVDTEYEAIKLGTHLKQEFANWGDKPKTFQLGELRQNPEDDLQPGKFVVLTRPAPGATLRDADNFGDGEVLILIGLDKNEGTLPASDTAIPYLLPEGYSSNLIISYERYFEDMIMEHIEDSVADMGGKFEKRDSGYVAVAGGVDVPGYSSGVLAKRTYTHTGFKLSLHEPGENIQNICVVSHSLESAGFRWTGDTLLVSAVIVDTNGTDYELYSCNFKANWDIREEFRPEIVRHEESGRPELLIKVVRKVDNFDMFYYEGGGSDYLKPIVEAWVRELVYVPFNKVALFSMKLDSIANKIDAFRLNGLLFRDESVVVPTYVAQPCDLTVLGHIAPKLTDYQLSHQEVTVSAEGTHAFTVTPKNSQLTWRVDPLPGEQGGADNVGRITADGRYTAPTAASFGDTFKRVVVTASDGTWSSKALVHLVARSVSVFPLVSVVNTTSSLDSGYLVWAASTNGLGMTWNIAGNAGGRLEVESDPNVQEARRYFGPATFPSDGKSELDKVLRLDRVEVSQGGGAVTACEMLLVSAPIDSYFFKPHETGGGLQLEFWVNNAGAESQVPVGQTHWHKVSGFGQLSESGFYTPADVGIDHYIIVAAFQDLGVPTPFTLWNYAIIPLPLATRLLH